MLHVFRPGGGGGGGCVIPSFQNTSCGQLVIRSLCPILKPPDIKTPTMDLYKKLSSSFTILSGLYPFQPIIFCFGGIWPQLRYGTTMKWNIPSC